MEASRSCRVTSSVLSNVLKQLWWFQKDAVAFSTKHSGVFLAMEMGTGKTLTTLASLAKRHHRGSVDRVIIICPAAAIHVWKREIKKWLPGTSLEFVIVSFDFARFYFKFVRKDRWDALVIDEAHKLKNPNSGQSRRIGLFAKTIPYRYALTGTQIAESVVDLFAQYRVVDDRIFGQKFPAFRDEYCYRTGWANKEVAVTPESKRRILHAIAPVTYQILKKEAFPNLKVLPPSYLFAELRGTQKKLYEAMEAKMLATHDDFTISAPRTVTQMIRLQQITGGHVPSDDGDMLTFECGKADVLADFLSLQSRKKKFVIFARFIYELDLIAEVCKKQRRSCCIYTPQQPWTEDHFQKRDDPNVFISQIDRGGIAITLTKSSTPIFFSKTYSHISYIQALSRVDRAGQSEPVNPIFLNTYNTIDEDVEVILSQKRTEAESVKIFLERLKRRLTLKT